MVCVFCQNPCDEAALSTFSYRGHEMCDGEQGVCSECTVTYLDGKELKKEFRLPPTVRVIGETGRICKDIHQYRIERGLSAKEVAVACKMSTSAVNAIESGRRKGFGRKGLCQVANFLGVDLPQTGESNGSL